MAAQAEAAARAGRAWMEDKYHAISYRVML